MELCKGTAFHLCLLIWIYSFQSMSFTFCKTESSHLQAFDLCPLILQLGLQLTDLGLLTADKRLFHHGLFLEL